MAKSEKRSVPIQKGRVSMEEQFSGKFRREPEMTRQDLENMALRRSGMTLTKHEPKR